MNKFDFLVLFILVFVLLGFFVLLHETAHSNSLKYFGVPSHFAIGNSAIETVPDSNVAIEKNNYIALAASINESIGYQLFPFLLFIVALLFLQLLVLFDIKKALVNEKN